MNKTKHTKFIKITNISDKISEKKRNICNFDKFCLFFLFIYSWTQTFKVGILYICIYIR